MKAAGTQLCKSITKWIRMCYVGNLMSEVAVPKDACREFCSIHVIQSRMALIDASSIQTNSIGKL
jgi:hypothetical protein